MGIADAQAQAQAQGCTMNAALAKYQASLLAIADKLEAGAALTADESMMAASELRQREQDMRGMRVSAD